MLPRLVGLYGWWLAMQGVLAGRPWHRQAARLCLQLRGEGWHLPPRTRVAKECRIEQTRCRPLLPPALICKQRSMHLLASYTRLRMSMKRMASPSNLMSGTSYLR